MMGVDFSELKFMEEQGEISLSQAKMFKEEGSKWYRIDTTYPNGHTLVNMWSQRRLPGWENPISFLDLQDLDLSPGEGVGPLGKGTPFPQCIHIILIEKWFWLFKFMMPDSLQKKYIERGYEFPNYVMNKAAQNRLDFWSNPFNGGLEKQLSMFEIVNGRMRYVFSFKETE